MQLTPNTLEILKNFAGINSNLMVREGSTLLTVSPTTSIVGKAVLDQTFDRSFGIYDLNKLLGCLALVGPEAEVLLEERSLVLTSKDGKVRYYYTDEQMLKTPKKEPNMLAPVLEFVLSQAEMDRLRKACATLGHRLIEISPGPEGRLLATVLDPKESTANTFSIALQGSHDGSAAFSFIFDIGNMGFLPGDYKAQLTERTISRFEHQDREVTYWVGMEATSTYSKA